MRLQLLGDLFQTIRARAFDEYEPVTDRMLVQISGERFRVGKSPVTASPGRFGEMSADQIGFLDPALLESLDDGPVLDDKEFGFSGEKVYEKVKAMLAKK